MAANISMTYEEINIGDRLIYTRVENFNRGGKEKKAISTYPCRVVSKTKIGGIKIEILNHLGEVIHVKNCMPKHLRKMG